VEDGFEDWYRAVYRRVYASVLLLTRERSVAGEAVDEAFARALEQWPRVRTMDSPVGWTFVVARNLVRRAHRRAEAEQAAMRQLDTSAPLPELTVEMWDAIRRLTPRAQELVALRYLAGLGEREIAAALGIAEGTVARGLHDARARLHETLAPDPAEERS
jgi:RNA polymerase sigma-70 factor (ECF subfamily)